MQTKLLAWGPRAIYLGPAFELSAHRNGVAVFCASLAGEMLVGEGREPADWVRCRTAYIPAGTLHVIKFEASPIACLYVDPQGDDVAMLEADVESGAGRLRFGHRRERELVALLAAVADGGVKGPQARMALGDLFGFKPPGPVDPRVAGAIEAMRNAPGDPHPLSELAAGAGLSESRFRHAFKAATGVPLKRFRVWNRIGAAMRAVQEGANLTEAAHAAGFASSAHFSAAFRAMFGLTPSAFAAARPNQRPAAS